MLRLTFLQKTSGVNEGYSRDATARAQYRPSDGVLEIVIDDSRVIEVRPRELLRSDVLSLGEQG